MNSNLSKFERGEILVLSRLYYLVCLPAERCHPWMFFFSRFKMCVYVCVCVCARAHACVCVCVCVVLRVCVFRSICTYICVLQVIN